MNKPFFSVIMPVYNTEAYIKKSIQSVLNQTFENFELICVNDFTKDKAFEICNAFAEKDKRIICVDSQKNIGASETRNKGLEIARGEYICFLDSDDELKKDALEKIYESTLSKPDIVLFGYTYVYSNETSKTNLSSRRSGIIRKDEISVTILTDFNHELLSCIGSKAYKQSFLNEHNITFQTKYLYNEDIAFALIALAQASEVFYLGESLYLYNIRESGSTMSSPKPNAFISLLPARELYTQFIEKLDDTNKNVQKTNFYRVVLGGIFECLRNEKRFGTKSTFKEVVDKTNQYKYFELLYNYFSKNMKEISLTKRIFIRSIRKNRISILWSFVK